MPLTPEFKQYVKQNASEIRATTHQTYNGMGFKVEDRKAVETSPEERETIYEAAWQRGGLQFRAAFQDMLVSKEANDTAADFIKRKIRSIVKDPKTSAILSDIRLHPYAAKRSLADRYRLFRNLQSTQRRVGRRESRAHPADLGGRDLHG